MNTDEIEKLKKLEEMIRQQEKNLDIKTPETSGVDVVESVFSAKDLDVSSIVSQIKNDEDTIKISDSTYVQEPLQNNSVINLQDDNFKTSQETEDIKNIVNIENDEIVFNNVEPIDQQITEKKTKKTTILSEVFDWVECIAVSVVFVVLLFTFVFRIVGVDGPSMQNTLHTYDKLVISNLFYKPAVGDVVVFVPNLKEYENKPFVKRIIALEGQKVDINSQTGDVFVDDIKINEPYIKVPTTDLGTRDFPITVEKGKIFVMGDNRTDSKDSRYSEVGDVDTRAIVGRCIVRIYPFNKIGALNK